MNFKQSLASILRDSRESANELKVNVSIKTERAALHMKGLNGIKIQEEIGKV